MNHLDRIGPLTRFEPAVQSDFKSRTVLFATRFVNSASSRSIRSNRPVRFGFSILGYHHGFCYGCFWVNLLMFHCIPQFLDFKTINVSAHVQVLLCNIYARDFMVTERADLAEYHIRNFDYIRGFGLIYSFDVWDVVGTIMI